MNKSLIVYELNSHCEYQDVTQNGYYFQKWTENNIDFISNNTRDYCVEIRDGHRPDLYLCGSCRSILEKYENMSTQENMTIDTLREMLEKVMVRLDKVENELLEIKSLQKIDNIAKE